MNAPAPSSVVSTVPGAAAPVFETARCIAPPTHSHDEALPIFRREFLLAPAPRNATLRVVGFGDYDVPLHGHRVAGPGINQPWSQQRCRELCRDHRRHPARPYGQSLATPRLE